MNIENMDFSGIEKIISEKDISGVLVFNSELIKKFTPESVSNYLETKGYNVKIFDGGSEELHIHYSLKDLKLNESYFENA